jgi:hypothetical protein
MKEEQETKDPIRRLSRHGIAELSVPVPASRWPGGHFPPKVVRTNVALIAARAPIMAEAHAEPHSEEVRKCFTSGSSTIPLENSHRR